MSSLEGGDGADKHGFGTGASHMQMVKQQPGSNQCGACAVAMVTDRTREEILAEVPHVEKPDHFWLNYMVSLGFTLEDVRDDKGFDTTKVSNGMIFNGHFKLPQGHRYYCSVSVPNGQTHAVAIDEHGMVFDPSTGAPMIGTCTLEEYVRRNQNTFGKVFISCCFRVCKDGHSTYARGTRERQT
jgi:hypothetical protein